MTREEAIDLLDNLIGMIEDNKNSDYDKALKMAIEALKQEPCEERERKESVHIIQDELISRQEVLDAISELNSISFYEAQEDSKECYYEIRKAIEQLQPKTGHWISHKEHCENLGVMPSGLSAYKWCSNCDCGIDVMEWHRNYYNYCPNCGAKMESEV